MTYVLSSAKIIKRIPKTESNPFGCVVVDKIPVDRPSVVAFGGDLTRSDKAANSYAKQVQNLLYENGINDVDVYSVVYNFGSSNPKHERAEQFRVAGRRISKSDDIDPIEKYVQDLTLKAMRQNEPVSNYVKQLFDILFLPRITDDNVKKIQTDDAIYRIRKLKFYAHCQGAAAIWQMSNYMHNKMLQLKYTPTEIEKIQKEMFVVQHSPVAPLTKQRFTTLSFASADDTMMQRHNNLFADWMFENSADVMPSFFDKDLGNLFVAGHLQEIPFKEHSNMGLTSYEEFASPLTADGKIIFNAERNAIVRAVQKSVSGEPVNSVKELVNGSDVDFDKLKQNGDALYKIMLNDLRQQNLKRGYQK